MPLRFGSATALAVPLALSACATARLAYDPAALRHEIALRAPAIPAQEVVVPFEIDETAAARARALVAHAHSDEAKVRLLVASIFDPAAFGISYAENVTATAAEALQRHEGNCLALASVFVGLARATGLRSYYIDASTRVHETRLGDDGLTVNEGHVTAMVETSAGKIGLDFGHLGKIAWYRVLDDVEALSHFYNNRGFELVDDARVRGVPIDWSQAEHQFRLAVEVTPGFARAWNNLGIAAAHLGRREEAIAFWRESIRRAPALPAPRNNLGALYLETGSDRAALETLEAAARLPESGPDVHYNLALARLRHGDRAGAVESLRRALRSGEYARAQRLLDQLTVATALNAAHVPAGRR